MVFSKIINMSDVLVKVREQSTNQYSQRAYKNSHAKSFLANVTGRASASVISSMHLGESSYQASMAAGCAKRPRTAARR